MTNSNQQKDQWRQRLESWRKSGLTQKQWCEQNNVRQPQFWYWKKKLQETHNEPETNKPASGFVPVALAPELNTPQTERASLSISLPNGMTVSGIDHSNLALIRQLIGLLQ